MTPQYHQNFIFEKDFPDNVKSVFFNGKTYSKEEFNNEKAKFFKRKSAKQLKVVR